jgi:trehalose 6-phosphate synthase/phosphatase
MALVAEHGAWILERGKKWAMLKGIRIEWKPAIVKILQESADRLPGSFVEEKEFSVCFHYRASDPELANFRLRQLSQTLNAKCMESKLQILPGNKVLEIRNAELNKGNACRFFLKQYPSDAVLAIGDDATDDDMFLALPPNSCAIKVGNESRLAKYHVPSYREVLKLIRELSSNDLMIS